MTTTIEGKGHSEDWGGILRTEVEHWRGPGWWPPSSSRLRDKDGRSRRDERKSYTSPGCSVFTYLKVRDGGEDGKEDTSGSRVAEDVKPQTQESRKEGTTSLTLFIQVGYPPLFSRTQSGLSHPPGSIVLFHFLKKSTPTSDAWRLGLKDSSILTLYYFQWRKRTRECDTIRVL